MFRLVVVAAVMACVSAGGHHAHWEAPVVATSYASHPITHVEKHVIPGRTYTEVHPQVAVVEQPYVTKVGEHVHNVPTGVSYQSSSVVHSKKVVTPVLAHGVQKHVVEAAPIYKTYQEPSIVKTIATEQHVAPVAVHAYPTTYAAPAVHYAEHAPLVHKTLAAPVAYASYAHAAPVVHKTLAAPLAYSGYANAGYAHSGYAHSAPVVKSVWGNNAGYVASPYSYGGAVVASPYTAATYGVKSALASPWSYGYGVNAAHQAW